MRFALIGSGCLGLLATLGAFMNQYTKPTLNHSAMKDGFFKYEKEDPFARRNF